MTFKVFSLFPIPVYSSNIGEISPDVIRQVESLSYTPKENGLAGISTEENLELQMNELIGKALPHCKKFFYEILNFKKDFKFKISDCWVAYFNGGSSGATPHTHDNSLYTCVVYLKSSNKGSITFNKPLNVGDFCINITPPIDENFSNEYNSNTFSFSPTDGDIIIFPANLTHKIEPNLTNERRYSFIFNMIPSGIVSKEASRRLTI